MNASRRAFCRGSPPLGPRHLHRWRPEAARDWMNKRPQNDPRRLPFFQNAVATMVNDPRGAKQLTTMSSAEQAAARALIEKMSISEERRSTLLEVLKPR